MRVALIPLYVNYYESVVPGGLESRKLALISRARDALGLCCDLTVFDRVSDLETARAARQRLLESELDCMIVLPLVATFSRISDELVRGWNKPLLLLSAMAAASIPATITMTGVVAESQSFGSQAIANGWMRQGNRFHALHVDLDSDAGKTVVRRWLAAHDAALRLPKLRIGLFGEPFEGMTDISFPAQEFSRDTGATIVRIAMSRLHSMVRSFSSQRVRDLESALVQKFAWGALSEAEKEASLRVALAILKLVDDEKLDCGAFNSHGPQGLQSPKIGVMAALGVSLAASQGCPLAEVGDLCTALAMWLGRRLGGACYYTELDSAYMPDREWLLLNSGEYDLNWLRPGRRPQLLPNTNFKGVNGRGASVCAPLREGPATILNFTPTPCARQPYRLQFCEGSILKRWRPRLGVGNAIFRVGEAAGSAARAYDRWLNAGPVHHSATSPGHLGAAISLFSELRGWTALSVTGQPLR